MNRSILFAVLAAFALIALGGDTSYQQFYQVEDFKYPPMDGKAYYTAADGTVYSYDYALIEKGDGEYEPIMAKPGDFISADQAFWTAIEASVNAAKAWGQAKLAQAQTDRFAKNLANLLYTTGLEIEEADGTTRTLTFNKGALGQALADKSGEASPVGAKITGASGGVDGKSIEKRSSDSKTQIFGFDTATSSTDEWWDYLGYFVPVKYTANGNIIWMKYGGYNDATFEKATSGDEKGSLQLAGWENPSCTASLNKMLSNADDTQNRSAHRILARYQQGSEPPTLHYIPIDGIIQGGGGGVAPDDESIAYSIDGTSTNLTLKGFAGTGGAKASASKYAPKIPYTAGGNLSWISFGSMFGDVFSKPIDAEFGLTLAGIDTAHEHFALCADGNGGATWETFAEAEYSAPESGDRHQVTFTKHSDGEDEVKTINLPRVQIETEDGASKLKWLDLNDSSSTMHEFSIGGSTAITDFYGDEEWSNFATFGLYLDYTDADGTKQTLDATVPVNGFEITGISTDTSATDKTTFTINGTGTDGATAIDLSFDVEKSQFDITSLGLSVTGSGTDSVSIQAQLDYKDQGGNAQTKTAPLTIPANLSASYIPLVDEISIWTNSASKKMEIKGFTGGAACGERLSDLLKSTDASQRASHEIICRYGTGTKSIHYLPIGDYLAQPDTAEFTIDSSTGKFKIKDGTAGYVLKSTGSGIEWGAASPGVDASGVLEATGTDTKTIAVKADAANNGKVLKTTNGAVGWTEALPIEQDQPLEKNEDGALRFKVASQSQGKVLTIDGDNKPVWAESVASAGGFAYNNGTIGAGAFAVGRKFYKVNGVAAGAGSWSLKVTVPTDGSAPSGQIVGVDAFSQTPTATECWIPLFTLDNDGVVEDYRGAAMIPAYN